MCYSYYISNAKEQIMNLLVYIIILGFIGGSFLFSSNNNANNVVDYTTLNQDRKMNVGASGDNEGNSANIPEPFYNRNITPSYNQGSPVYDFNDNSDREAEIEERRAEAEDLQSRTEDLNSQINRLRRNADSYDVDEFSSKLKKLQWEADDLSSGAGDLGADDAAGSLDDVSYKLRRLRNDVEDEPRYFYGEREDDVSSGLKRSEWETDDAVSNFDDFSSELEDWDF